MRKNIILFLIGLNSDDHLIILCKRQDRNDQIKTYYSLSHEPSYVNPCHMPTCSTCQVACSQYYYDTYMLRLGAVSLFLENPRGRMQRTGRLRYLSCARERRSHKPQVLSQFFCVLPPQTFEQKGDCSQPNTYFVWWIDLRLWAAWCGPNIV